MDMMLESCGSMSIHFIGFKKSKDSTDVSRGIFEVHMRSSCTMSHGEPVYISTTRRRVNALTLIVNRIPDYERALSNA